MVRPQQRKKSSAVPRISERSHVGNLCQTLQGKGEIYKRVETAGVYPLVRPRGVSALPPPRGAANPLAESQRITPARQGRTRLRSSRPPVSRCRKTACAVRIPSVALIPRKRKRHRSRGASPFCGYVGRLAAAVAAITAAAAGIITTGTAGTAAAAALTAAYPDQDDKDDDPPPGIFAPEAVRRTHTVISSYQRFHYILW